MATHRYPGGDSPTITDTRKHMGCRAARCAQEKDFTQQEEEAVSRK